MKFLFCLPLLALSALAHADSPSVHGMLLFGSKRIYVSHLPMFHKPHDYQLIAELELPAEAIAAYEKARLTNREETVYTLVPERFSLPEMAANPRPFKAVLFQGHFERGGAEITGEVKVKIAKVLHFRKFLPGAKRPAAGTYLLFGDANEAFAAHFISARPDFDQVSEISFSAELPAGKTVQVETKGLNDLKPLPEGVALPVTFPDNSGNSAAEIRVKKTLYFETGDLE